MRLEVTLASDAERLEARSVHVIKLTLDKGLFARGLMSVKFFPRGGRAEGELVGRNTKNRPFTEQLLWPRADMSARMAYRISETVGLSPGGIGRPLSE